jgi:predicted transcriptional regulator
MEITLTSEQETYLSRLAVQAGRSTTEVVHEALAEWVGRQTTLVELRASLDAAEASIARGEGIEITSETMHSLADDVKRRGCERAIKWSKPL